MFKLIPLALLLIGCSSIPDNCQQSQQLRLTLYMGCVEHSPTPNECLGAAEKLSYICYDDTKVIQ